MKRADEILAWEMRASGDDYTYEDVVRLAFVLLTTEEQEDFDDFINDEQLMDMTGK